MILFKAVLFEFILFANVQILENKDLFIIYFFSKNLKYPKLI